MTQNDILKKLLDEYIENIYLEGAFYINGAWGIGKTKFIIDYIKYRNDLSEKEKDNNKRFKNIYISLNGITSKEQISSSILAQMHPKLTKIGNSLPIKLIKTAVKSISYANPSGVSVDLDKIHLQDIEQIKENIVLYFDDLERCMLNVCETLGYINQFVEQDKIKVVILGNDLEIRNYSEKESIFQYKLIASILSINNTEKTEKEVKNIFDDSTQKSSFKSKYEEISDKLYYELIKEKVISQEYQFYFDKNVILDEIFSSKEGNGVFKIAASLIDTIIDYSKCCNIRTYKCARYNIDNIYKNMKVNVNKMTQAYIVCNVILETMSYKNPNILKEVDFKESTVVKIDHISGKSFYCLKSIHDYIYNGAINEKQFKIELNYLRDELTKNKNANSVPVLRDLSSKYWDELDDDYLQNKITQMINDVSSKKIPIKFYPVVLKNYYIYKDVYNEFTEPKTTKEELKKTMLNNIYEVTASVEGLDYDEYFFESGNLRSAIKEIYDAVDEKNKQLNSSIEMQKIKKSISRLTSKEINKISQSAYSDKCFLSKFKSEELISFLREASNKDLMSFRRVLNNIYYYNANIFKSDYDIICKLIEKVEIFISNEAQIIRKRNLNNLKELLQSYKSQMKNV